MNLRSTYILLGVVGVALAALGLTLVFEPDPASRSGFLFGKFSESKIKPDDVTTVEYERGPEKLTFVRTPQKLWKLASPSEAKLDQRAVNDMVRDLIEARTVPATGDAPKTVKAAGLEDPAIKVTLKKGVEAEATISVGAVEFGESALVSCLSSDAPGKVLQVRRSSLRGLLKPGAARGSVAEQARTLSDFRSMMIAREGLGDPITQVQKVSITSGAAGLVLEKGGDKAWRFIRPQVSGLAEAEPLTPGAPGDVASVKQLLEQLTGVQATAPSDFIDKPDALAAYGLDEANANRVVAEWTFEPTGTDPAPRTSRLVAGNEVEGKSDQVFVQVDGIGPVVKVSGAPIRALRQVLAKPSVLRERTMQVPVASAVDAMTTYSAAGIVELSARDDKNSDWRVAGAEGKSSKAAKASVDAVLAAIAKPRLILGFPELSDAAMGLDKPQAALYVWADAFAGEPKPDAKPPTVPTLKITFGKTEGAGVYARVTRDGIQNDFLLPASLLGVVARDRLAYLDLTPRTLNIDAVTKLTFNRGAEVYTLEKDAGSVPLGVSSWKVTAPEALKGKPADAVKIGVILPQLASLRPNKVIAESPDAAQLAAVKLGPKPLVSVTLGLDAGEPLVYEFGDPAGADAVHAKLPGLEMIAVVSKVALDATQQGPVADTTLFRLDRAQVSKVRLTGWGDGTNAATMREFVLKDNKSELVGGGYEFDAKAFDAFLAPLLTPKPEGSEAVGDTPDAKFGFDPAKGALKVEIEADGKTQTLTAGAADPSGKFYYTLAGDRKNEALLMPKELFDKARSKPKPFAKE